MLLVLVVLIALPFVIDINSFRPRLETDASLALGRKVKLGNLNLSIVSASIGADDIEIADDPVFSSQNFISAKSVRIAIALRPLIFERKIEVKGIELIRPQVTLLKGDNDTWNFSSLGAAAYKSRKDETANLPAVSVARFRAEDGAITVGELNSTRASRLYDHVQLEVTEFSSATPFHFDLSSSLPGGGDTRVSGIVGPISATNAARSTFDLALQLNNMHIATFGFVPPESGIDGVANLDETMRSDGNKVTLAGTFQGSRMKLAPGGKPTATVISIHHTIEMDLEQHTGRLTEADIHVGKALLHASGSFQYPAGKQLIDVQLSGTGMPIDDFQSVAPALDVKTPYGSYMRGGTAAAKLRISGPPTDLTVTGHISAANTTQVGFNLGAQLGSVAAFAGKAISSPDTAVKSMSFDILVTRAGVQVDHIDYDIPSVCTGTGSGTITPDGQLSFAMLSYPTSGMAGGLVKMSSVGGGKGNIPMTITGTAEKPVFTTDTKAATRSIVAETAKGAVSVSAHAIGNLFKKKPKNQTDTQPAPTDQPK